MTQTAEQKRAWRKRRKERDWGTPVPAHLKHGQKTVAADIYGCDCRECLPSGRRNAATPEDVLTVTERHRRLRARKKGTPVPPGTKHGIYTYRVYGCRCDFCVLANRRSRGKKRVSWRETAVGSWSTRGDSDVVHWPPVGDGAWTCPECGQNFEKRRQLDARAA